MTQGPPLQDGETVVHDHVPSFKVFRRAALFLLLISLLPTAAFAIAFPDSLWVMLPIFLACILLVQERFKLGRHRAWITDRRIILQTGESVDLADITETKPRSVVVGVRHGANGAMLPLYYPANSAALADAITAARSAP